jgi:uncharacterized protein YjbI with pentapeptide repeats
MVELEQRTVMRGLLQANYNCLPYRFPSGHLFAPRMMGAALDRVVMNEVKMPSADLRFSSVTDASLVNVDLNSARGQEIGLSRTRLEHVNMARSFFSRAVVRETIFSECCLDRCFLDKIEGRASCWEGCKGSRAVFDESDLTEAKFCDVHFEASSFSEADLTRALFENCRLVNVDFSMSVLWQTTFRRCHLIDCSFSGVRAHQLQFQKCELEDSKLSPLVKAHCLFS